MPGEAGILLRYRLANSDLAAGETPGYIDQDRIGNSMSGEGKGGVGGVDGVPRVRVCRMLGWLRGHGYLRSGRQGDSTA